MAYCPSCGAQHPDGAGFCPSCGRPLRAGAATAARGYGGFWRRFVAFVIDWLVINIPLGLVARAGSADAGFRLHHDRYDLNYTGVWAIIALVAHWLYFALQESSARGATLGKLALGVRVTDEQGNRISFGRATGRFFAKLLSALIIFIGFIMAGFTSRKRALHDMIADTLVEKV